MNDTTTFNDLFEAAERRGARRERDRQRTRRRIAERRELARRMLGGKCSCGSSDRICYALREPGSHDSGGLAERGWTSRPEIVCGELAMRVPMCRRCFYVRTSALANAARRRAKDERRDPVSTAKAIRASFGIV